MRVAAASAGRTRRYRVGMTITLPALERRLTHVENDQAEIIGRLDRIEASVDACSTAIAANQLVADVRHESTTAMLQEVLDRLAPKAADGS